ncbi:uncharacterized protein TRIVIDRAFT_53358, partial [Trichoderma virens Gv29-8]
KLNNTKIYYLIYNKEFLGIKDYINEWNYYCRGNKHKIKIYINYKNITFFTTTQKLFKR